MKKGIMVVEAIKGAVDAARTLAVKQPIAVGAFVVAGVSLFAPDVLQAVTAPSSPDSFAYDIYKVAVEDILQGPIGFVAGAGAIVLGAVSAMQQKVMAAIPAILGGAALIKADAIVQTMGALF